MTADEPQERPSAWVLLVLVLLAVLPYLPTLWDPLFADDYLHIERTGDLSSGSAERALRSWVLRADDAAAWWTPSNLAIPYFRPLVSISFFVDHVLWGLEAFGYRLSNLLLHVLATLTCYALANRLLGRGTRSIVAAALFAIHPCHIEAVVWVSGRTDLLCGLFYGLAMWLLLDGTRSKGTARTLLGLVCFGMALTAKEMAITLPAVLLLCGVLTAGGSIRPRTFAVAGSVLVAGGYLALRWWSLGGFVTPPHPFAHAPGDPDFLSQITLAPLLYLADLVLFVPPDPVITQPFWLEHPVLLGALAIVTIGALAGTVRAVEGWRARAVFLGWLALALLPVIPVSVGERFLYGPSLAYCLLVGARAPVSFRRSPPGERRGVLLLGAVVLVVALTKSLLFSSVTHRSRQSIDDALRAIDSCASCSTVLVADLPAASALAFPHAIRLERPARRLHVELLSVAPQFLGTSERRSTLSLLSPTRFSLDSGKGPYLMSYIERAFLGERPAFAEGDVVERGVVTVRVQEVLDGHPRRIEVELRVPREAALILQGRGFGLETVSLE